jgi:DivIVA domain-containing protein
MDSPPAKDQQAGAQSGSKSIDSLRTVEFRVTLRGYHIDDVDEYLERVAVEAEQLQEQLRLSADRLKQANERATTLEQQLEQARRQERARPPAPEQAPERSATAGEAAEDTLSRTLLLAQKFVEQTRQEAERESKVLVSDAESRARRIVADAEEHARAMTQDAERNLREEVARLDSTRAQLVGDVETIAKHLELERARIRKALTDMLEWVDEHVQPPDSDVVRDDERSVGPEREIRPHGQSHSSAPERPTRATGGRGRDEGGEKSQTSPTSHSRSRDAGRPADETAERDAERAQGEVRVRDGATYMADVTSSTDAEDGYMGMSTQPVSSGSDGIDQVDGGNEAIRDANTTRRSLERTASHQREMFSSGREAHQAGSTSR